MRFQVLNTKQLSFHIPIALAEFQNSITSWSHWEILKNRQKSPFLAIPTSFHSFWVFEICRSDLIWSENMCSADPACFNEESLKILSNFHRKRGSIQSEILMDKTLKFYSASLWSLSLSFNRQKRNNSCTMFASSFELDLKQESTLNEQIGNNFQESLDQNPVSTNFRVFARFLRFWQNQVKQLESWLVVVPLMRSNH